MGGRSGEQSAAIRASSFSSGQPPPSSSLIRDLSIQLGTMIPDAEFVSSHASRLFHYLTTADRTTASTKEGRFSKYELRRDMVSNREYYEAACFYLAVEASEGGNVARGLRELSAKRIADARRDAARKATADGNDGDGAEDDAGEEEEEERTLTVSDVSRVAGLLEATFETVIDCVREWTAGLPAAPATVGGDADGSSAGGGGPTVLFEIMDSGEAKVSEFDRWKEKVLREARVKAQKKIIEGKSGGCQDWRTVAADDALRAAGLLRR